MPADVRVTATSILREALGPVVVAAGAIVVLFSLPFVGLWLLSSVEDEILWRRLSPDGRREIQAVRRDQTAGLIAGERFGVLRMRRAKGWGLGSWEELARVSQGEVARMSEQPAWIDDGHVVITVPADARIPALPRSVMGVEVTFVRRGP